MISYSIACPGVLPNYIFWTYLVASAAFYAAGVVDLKGIFFPLENLAWTNIGTRFIGAEQTTFKIT